MRTTLSLFLFAASLTAAPVVLDGPKLYKIHCAMCHGADGSGGTGANLLGKLTHSGRAATANVVKHGISGTAMPAAKLTDPEIRRVVAYVYTLRGAHHSK